MKMNLIIFGVILVALVAATLFYQMRTPNIQNKIVNVPISVASEKRANLPSFAFETIDGAAYESGDLTNKKLLINFWASWCAPCIIEFPHLLELAKRYPDDITLLLISSDRTPEDIPKFTTRLTEAEQEILEQDNVKMIFDTDKKITQGIFQTFRLPETILVENGGHMIQKLVGANWSVEEVKRALNLSARPSD
jgi:thiol-disulfide isomerase/thioredoxin